MTDAGVGHKPKTTYAPLSWRVHHDIELCIVRFGDEAIDQHNFAQFAAIFSSMHFADILKTQDACGRVPAKKERLAEYVEQLLALVVRHLRAHASFGRRLGALFLVYCLYRLHQAAPQSEPALITIEEDDWSAVETLADELRTCRHADGFRALHELWTRGAFKHLKVRHVFSNDSDAECEAERQARRFAANVAIDKAAVGGTSESIRQIMPALEELVDEYQRKRDAALIFFNSDRRPACTLDEVLVTCREADATRRVRRRQAAEEAAEATNPDVLAHRRRVQKRRGPYAPMRPVVGLQSANVARRNMSLPSE